MAREVAFLDHRFGFWQPWFFCVELFYRCTFVRQEQPMR